MGAITDLVRGAYAEYVPRIGREPAPLTCDYVQVVDAGHTWVAEAQDRSVVGVLVLALARTHLLIENVAVAANQQGAGIGALLLRTAEEQALRAGLGQIRLYTNEAMTPNLTYYPPGTGTPRPTAPSRTGTAASSSPRTSTADPPPPVSRPIPTTRGSERRALIGKVGRSSQAEEPGAASTRGER